MSIDIRPATMEEMADFQHVAFTSLVMPSDVLTPEVIQAINPDWTLCAFDNGKMATSYAAWPFVMQMNGRAAPVLGVTCVGTLPVYRGQGHLGQLIPRHFQTVHEKGDRPMVVLYASQAAIYQRFGFAVTSTRHAYRIDPRDLLFAGPGSATGRFTELKIDDFSILSALYGEFQEKRNGYVRRGKGSWRFSVLKHPAKEGHLLNSILYEEGGVPAGYVIYTAEPLERASSVPRHRIHIRDLVWRSPLSYQALWNYFSRMKLAEEIIWDKVPPDDPLPHLLLEPRALNQTAMDGLLGRIVDVGKALTERGYNAEGALRFEIRGDEICPWNNGRWKLETAAGQGSVKKTIEEPEAVMPISTMAMLLFGQISATEAARMGRLDVCDAGALAKWDGVFQTAYRLFCADLF
jgi:predicted acetyltransferase